MGNVSCPYCRDHVHVNASLSGKLVRCSHCGAVFTAPKIPDCKGAAQTPLHVKVVALIGGHIVAWLLLGIVIGLLQSTMILVFAVGTGVAVWQRERLLAWLQEAYRNNRGRKRVEAPNDGVVRSACEASDAPKVTAKYGQGSEQPIEAQIIDTEEDIRVEVDVSAPYASKREIIPPPPLLHDRIPGGSIAVPLNLDLPTDGVFFLGPGTVLDLGRGSLKNALVYATNADIDQRFDASLISARLPVSSPNLLTVDALPYWPTYAECSPEQRSRYLDWLVAGRRDPCTELGYVFIYFYGLERRVLIEGTDILPIVQELVRLSDIYSHSNSFRAYSASLLWVSILLAGRWKPISEELLLLAINATCRWNEDNLQMCLAYHCMHDLPLRGDVAFIAVQNDPRARSSVIIKRHGDKFSELFCRKYRAKFGDGLMLRASKRPKQINYRPASPTLLRDWGYESASPLGAVPNVLAISSQLKPLLGIWDECIDDLRAYSRAQGASSGTHLTAEAYEALPVELQDGNHPEEAMWMELWEEYADHNGWPLVPISRLAEIKGISQRDRLTKAQSARILATADAMGIGVEPDSRLTGRPYRWDERVSTFFLETGSQGETAPYNAAAVLLRLGLSVSAADGHIDKDELALITEHLETGFDLTRNQSKRLEQLKYLLLHSDEADKTVSTVLKKRLPQKHRLLIGRFLVAIAAVDQVVTPEEVKALRQAYRALGLESSELDRLLIPHIASTAKPDAAAKPESGSEHFCLNMHAVSSIMAETKKVAAVLHNVMAEDEEDGRINEEPAPTTAAVNTRLGRQHAISKEPRESVGPISGLDASSLLDSGPLPSRFQPFLKAIIRQPTWNEGDARALAREHNIMLAGAIEAINEWSCECLGDWLIEEDDDRLHVQINLIENGA